MFGLRVSQFKLNCSAVALAIASSCVISSAAHADGPPRPFDIPQESASKSLIDFSKQSGLQIMAPYDKAAKITTPAVKGEFTPDQALAKLLDNSGLEIASRTDTTIYLRVATQKVSEKSSQVRAAAGQDQSTEVVVTGTRIRNSNPTSPVHVVTRQDIDVSGYSQVGDVVRSLPENFSGGQNPGVIGASATNAANNNGTNSSTVNLRGLGTDATLVLVDGHRLSADYYEGPDISGIPLEAVQRIEVVTDGASSLYGSDAVAGVVNFILRKDFNGAEVTSSVGSTSDGGGEQQTYSILSGISRPDWHLLGNFEWSKQDAITAGQRDLPDAVPSTTLIQPQTRNSLFFTAGRDFGDRVSLSVEGLLSDRFNTATLQQTASAPTYQNSNDVPAISLSSTLNVDLSDNWKAHFTFAGSGSQDVSWSALPAYDYASSSVFKNSLGYGEATADGPLFDLASGTVSSAIGAGYRTEGFTLGAPGSSSSAHGNRTIAYAFGEALIPVVSRSNSRPGLEQLDLTLSGRVENYSDFGTAATPKIGFRYVPVPGLTLRGTWGQSFKAPSFEQMYESTLIYLLPLSRVGGSGNGTALLTFGGNADLKPEKSKSWTFGGDFHPQGMKSFALSITVFGIDYRDRVVTPVSNYAVALSDPLYAPFVEGSPSSARQSALINASNFFYNFTTGAYDPSTVEAVVNDRSANATAQTVAGLDLSAKQVFNLSKGRLSAFVGATALTLKQQTIPTAPDAELSGTIFNVPSMKARGGVVWEDGELSISGIANYIDHEKDTGVTPFAEIGSWTTIDATAAYQVPKSSGIWSGVRVALSASNLMDRAPPHAISPTLTYGGVNFDSTNASIIGRFTSLTVSKSW